ncbi:MAG: hypothetical protein LBT15_03015 [Synergistaceae bacterium]|nr:hypothetical protein [Synergistaceae bacterium]
MANAVPHFEGIKGRIVRAREMMETRDLLSELLNLPEHRLLPIFGVTQWAPHEVHGLKDQIFLGVITELVKNGWNCNSAAFGEGRRDTFLMEMARCGYPKSVTRLLEMGAEADHNSQGYGASTPMMCTRDPEIMKKLLYYGTNPLATNALGETDFTYKLLKGYTPGARFYLYNTEKIPFQSLLSNFRDCVLSHNSVPYEPMYPLCLIPVVPAGVPYTNVIDRSLVDSMLREQYLPFTSRALSYPLNGSQTVWQYIRLRLDASRSVVPALVIALMACMAKLEECRTPEDFAFLESYIAKPIPRELNPKETLSKAVFVYLLFSLSILPAPQILRWLVLLDRLLRRLLVWMDSLGELPFRVVNSLISADKRGSHMLQELATMQALLAMRVNVSDSFGEFRIPDELSGMLAMNENIE